MASADDFPDRDLIESLLVELYKGEISRADKERLNELLLGSREGRRLFLQYAHIEAGLHWIYAARQQVATVIDGTSEGAVRPTADIAQQQLRFADDPRFVQIMHSCAPNEAHSQEWLQIFPRVLAVTSLCAATASSARDPVQDVIDAVHAAYATDMSLDAFWAAVHKATRDVLLDATTAHEDVRRGVDALLSCAFAASGVRLLLDATAILEVLDDCIPHRLPADTLRVLCLRYINGLASNRIALHLKWSARQVQAQLAQVRVHLVSKCLDAAGADLRYVDVAALLRWSTLFDAPSREPLVVQAGPMHNVVNPAHVLLLAVVHDYLSRHLSAMRLLEEVPVQNDKSYLHAIEQSIRDIEALGTTQHERATAHTGSQRMWRLAAFVGIAAGLLLAVGVAMLGDTPGGGNAVPPRMDAAAGLASSPAPAPVDVVTNDATPPETPVVAEITEAIGVSAQDRDRLAVGSKVRMQDIVAFEQGVVELSTKSGCTLVLEGPIDVSVAGDSHLVLRRGKLVGLDDHDGESLIIDAPKSSIVDIGTEFGVGVDKLDETMVAVYEGEVRLEPIDGASTQQEVLQLNAGWEMKIEASAEGPVDAVPLKHEREFVRADEVQLRKAAARGRQDAYARVSYFDLLRTEGLICYQGFHDAAAGSEFSIGFRSPAIRSASEASFGPNILIAATQLGPSQSLSLGKDATCYLDIDVGPRSRLERTGLVDENGLIGSNPGELWLCWRTKATGPPGAEFSWAGLSLMFGDNRSADETLFVGQPEPLAHYGIHAYPGAGKPRELSRTLDRESAEPGEQPMLPDFDEHLWLVRLRMSGSTAEVAVWCDAPPEQAATLPPGATDTISEFRFDRVRLEAHPVGAEGSWLFDDVIIASSSDVVAETLRLVSQTASPALP